MKFSYKEADEPLTMVVAQYPNGRDAILIVGDETGERWANLTVNIPDASLGENEVIIKNWSENEFIAKAAFSTGVFSDTGRTIATGHVKAPIWKIIKLDEYNKLKRLK